MNTNALEKFLSKENIEMHREHARMLSASYSLKEKCYPKIGGKSLFDISRIALPKDEKEEIMKSNVYIKLHEVYFASFCEAPKPSMTVRRHYGSEDKLCYELLERARASGEDIMMLALDRRGMPQILSYRDTPFAPLYYDIRLALDLYEHAYFFDYGFNREGYLRHAIASLDLPRLDA
jgi:superoxide dismutase